MSESEVFAVAELLALDVLEMTIFDPVIPYERARRLLELIAAAKETPCQS